MADVLASPGVPKPRLARQNARSVLGPGFISAASSSRATLKRPFPCCDDLPYSPGNWGSSLGSSVTVSRKSPRLQTRSYPSLESTRSSSSSSSRRDLRNMSHTPLVMHHPPTSAVNHRCSSERKIQPAHRATTMPLQNTFMTAPAMETTTSSSGSSIGEAEHGPFGPLNKPLLLSSADTVSELVHTMTPAEAVWAMKTPSFGSGTEDTSSISSSFDYMDMPKPESRVYNGIPPYDFYPTSQAIDKPVCINPHDTKFAPSTLHDSTSGPSCCEWPGSDTPEPWRHDMAADEQAWTSTEYLSSCWLGQRPLPNAGPVDCPTTTQTPCSLQNVQLSSTLDHLPSFKPASSNQPEAAFKILETNNPIPTTPPPHHPYSYPDFTSGSPPPTHFQPQQSAAEQQTPLASEEDPAQDQNQPKTNIKRATTLHYTDTRNAFLIDCKRRGLSYKDIKRIGGFKEAESTLRGRYRTLTKAKEHRVRKPKWQERDIHLLCEAVAVCAGADTDTDTASAFGQPPAVEGVVEEGGAVYLGAWGVVSVWECDV